MNYPTDVIHAAETLLNFQAKNPEWAENCFMLPHDLQEAVQIEKNKFTAADLMAIWNNHKAEELPKCTQLTAKRRGHANARIKEHPDKDVWIKFILTINQNNWATGKNPSRSHPNWKANFDWFTKPESILRFIEGNFRADNTQPKPATRRDEYADELETRNDMYGGR